MSAATTEVVSVAELVAALRRQQEPRRQPEPEPGPKKGRVVCIVGVHPGAGATTVAIAIADALDEIDQPVHLLDMAPEPDAFAAADYEVDAEDPAWKAGRRGQTKLLRPRSPGAAPPALPVDVLVDGQMDGADGLTMVCRATLPSIRRVEADLPDDVVVAVVGCSRWPKVVAASLGPALRRADDDGRVVFVPFDRNLALYGIEPEPLPRSVRAAGQRLIELLWPDLDDAAPLQRRKAFGR